MPFKSNFNIFLALIFLVNINVEARDVIWDTSPKVHTFIVKNFIHIKRRISFRDYALLEEIKSQMTCSSKPLNIDNIQTINNELLTPVKFSMKIINELSC